ncbi:MAG: hypothetical protein ACI37J_08895 [Candidatus Bruticola sp.]
MNYKGAVCALALVAAFSIGCTAKSANQAAEQAKSAASEVVAVSEEAKPAVEVAQNDENIPVLSSKVNPNFKVIGSYYRENSSQYNNGILVITDFSEGLKIFEFNILSGSEANDSATSYRLAGVFNVDLDKVGQGEFDSIVAGQNGKIHFELSKDGKMINVTAEGPKNQVYVGSYSYYHPGFDISLGLAKAVLEELPGAVTGLTQAAGKYTIKLFDNEDPLLGIYYEVEAIDKRDQVIGSYLVSKDLQSVVRTDIGDLKAIRGDLTPEMKKALLEVMPKG